jgi:phosphoribosylaminoimidazole-succinocarboxamide synthase
MANPPLIKTEFEKLKLVNRGKVRDVYEVEDKLLMVVTDRISAFDVVMDDPIPCKGEVLTKLSLFWFDYLKKIIPNHLITADVNEYPEICSPYLEQLKNRSMLVKKARPLPIECIVRGYLSGSFWKAYQKNTTVCGFELPEGMQESDKFPNPLFTPSTKAEQGLHDENISIEQMEKLLDKEQSNQIAQICVNLYKKAADFALEKGIIIADTKFELGYYEGELILIDEVLTADSSRFWPQDLYTPGQGQSSFDKQFMRDYLNTLDWPKSPPAPKLPSEIINKTSERYIEALAKITGEKLEL